MSVIVDLKPNRNLLDPNFESYRLSLESLPVVKQNLPETGIHKASLSEDCYSYLHAKFLSLFNPLSQDPWEQNAIFYATENKHIFKSGLSQSGHLLEPKLVWQIPEADNVLKYFVSLSFPGQDWTVACDGFNIYILNSPSRSEGIPWQLSYSQEIENLTWPCQLLHSVYNRYPTCHQIDILLGHIVKVENLKTSIKVPGTNGNFAFLLEWFTFTGSLQQESDKWSLKRHRTLLSGSVPEYVALDNSAGSVNVVAEKEIAFIEDSVNPVQVEISEENKPEKKGPPVYSYMQSLDDITVIMKLPNDTLKKDISVSFHPNKMEIHVKSQLKIGGDLWHTVKPVECAWTIDKDRLEIILTKAEQGLMWQELIRGDKQGEEVMDPELTEEINNKLAHLTSENEEESRKPNYNLDELDECDEPVNVMQYQRLDGELHKVSHVAHLGGHQWLFQLSVNSEELPVICLRHDVDGIVWQPRNLLTEDEHNQFSLEHVATFPALGYVQASKQDRLFLTCSSNFKFSALCDSKRHVYIYHQPTSVTSGEVRNRKTGKEVSTLAKQQVVNLELCDGIIGLRCSKECIFILSNNMIFGIKMI